MSNKKALEGQKAPANRALRYILREVAGNRQICQIMGQSTVEIYERHGFVEISEEEFHQIWAEKREEWRKKGWV